MKYYKRLNIIDSSKKSKINEDFFDEFDDEIENADVEKSEEEILQDIAKNIDVKRSLSTDLNLNDYEDKIKKWLKDYTTTSNTFDSYDDFAKILDRMYYDSNFPVVIFNSDGTLDVYGNIVVANVVKFPDYVYFNEIHAVNTRHVNKKGNFEFRNCKFRELPEGTPEKIDGNFVLFNCSNLESIYNSPKDIEANFNIHMCSNLEDYTNVIKHLGGSAFVLSNISTTAADILSSSIFNQKISEEVQERINEGIIHKNFNTLNEAFDSDILKRLFNNPNNVDAVKAIKSIPVLWSELSDFSIFPCYGGLDKIMKLRKESDPSKYGLTLLCDKNNKINFILSGDNRSLYIDAGGETETWKNKSFVYVNKDMYNIINKRIDIIIIANRNLESSNYNETDKQRIAECRQQLEECGVDYKKVDVYSINKVHKSDDLTFKILGFIPDYCIKGYIMKSSNDSEDENNFTFISNRAKRNKIHRDRSNDIYGSYIMAGKNRMNSPLYKKYYSSLISDNVFANLNNRKYDIYSVKRMAETIKQGIIDGVNQIRDRLINAYKSNVVSGELLDQLYYKFQSCDYKDAIERCDKTIEKAEEWMNEFKLHANYYGYTDDRFEKNYYSNKLNAQYLNKDTFGFTKFISYAIDLVSKFAALLTALDSYESGNKAALEDRETFNKMFRERN